MWIIITAAIAILAPPAPARASQVRIPLTIDYITLREALKRKLYTAPGGRAQLWNGLDDCQFLYAENPEFSHAAAGGAATVKLETANSLGLGVAMGSQCLGAIQWSGIVEALGVPYIAPGLQLKFHFTDLNLYDSAHQKTQLVSQGFDLIKSYLIPRLDDFSYDLNPVGQATGRDGLRFDRARGRRPRPRRNRIAHRRAEHRRARRRHPRHARDDYPRRPGSNRDSGSGLIAHARRTQSLSGHARSMGRVPGFFRSSSSATRSATGSSATSCCKSCSTAATAWSRR